MSLTERKTRNENGDWSWFHDFAGIYCPFNFYVLHQFSRIITDNNQIKLIAEIGQWRGGMSVALGLEGIRKGISVHSFEIQKQTSEETDKILERLGVQTHYIDALIQREDIFEIIKSQPTFLICDGGNKREEFAMCLPHLQKGSIVAVHDYGLEFFAADWTQLENIIEPLYPWTWLEHNCQLAIFKKL